MEFQYYGGNCISITTKTARIVIDDNLSDLGLKTITKPTDIAVFTNMPSTLPDARLSITDPGEYEISEVSIFGLSARGHMDEEGTSSATIYKVQFGDIRVCIVGHIHPGISEEYLEELGSVDILFVPVGGNGYTLDPVGAQSIIKKVSPKIVIPTNYDDPKLKYPVDQQPLESAMKVLNLEPKDTVSKFKPKPTDISENIQLVVLTRS